MLPSPSSPAEFCNPEAWAIERGAVFETNGNIEIPLHLFTRPGVFGEVRQRMGGLRCPSCHSYKFERHGRPTRARRPVQQYRCLRPKCRPKHPKKYNEKVTILRRSKGSRVFNEYTGSPLENCCIGAYEWFAIWHWYWEDPSRRVLLPVIAETLGLSSPIVRRCVMDRMSFTKTRAGGNPYRYAYDPTRVFYTSRNPWHEVSVVSSTDQTTELTQLVLRVSSNYVEQASPDAIKRQQEYLKERQRIRLEDEEQLKKPPPTWKHRYLE